MILINVGLILVSTLGIWNVFGGQSLDAFFYGTLKTTAIVGVFSALGIGAGVKLFGIDISNATVYIAFIAFTTLILGATSSIFVYLASYIGADSYVNILLALIALFMPPLAIMQMKTGGWENYR